MPPGHAASGQCIPRRPGTRAGPQPGTAPPEAGPARPAARPRPASGGDEVVWVHGTALARGLGDRHWPSRRRPAASARRAVACAVTACHASSQVGRVDLGRGAHLGAGQGVAGRAGGARSRDADGQVLQGRRGNGHGQVAAAGNRRGGDPLGPGQPVGQRLSHLPGRLAGCAGSIERNGGGEGSGSVTRGATPGARRAQAEFGADVAGDHRPKVTTLACRRRCSTSRTTRGPRGSSPPGRTAWSDRRPRRSAARGTGRPPAPAP